MRVKSVCQIWLHRKLTVCGFPAVISTKMPSKNLLFYSYIHYVAFSRKPVCICVSEIRIEVDLGLATKTAKPREVQRHSKLPIHFIIKALKVGGNFDVIPSSSLAIFLLRFSVLVWKTSTLLSEALFQTVLFTSPFRKYSLTFLLHLIGNYYLFHYNGVSLQGTAFYFCRLSAVLHLNALSLKLFNTAHSTSSVCCTSYIRTLLLYYLYSWRTIHA
jgi:hypothetical protein